MSPWVMTTRGLSSLNDRYGQQKSFSSISEDSVSMLAICWRMDSAFTTNITKCTFLILLT
eukprot:Gb_09841 [translate_table: standard]